VIVGVDDADADGVVLRGFLVAAGGAVGSRYRVARAGAAIGDCMI
jgi:hypothetical protein